MVFDSEFYHLIKNYRDCYLSQAVVQSDRDALQKLLDELTKETWTMETNIATGNGFCGDGLQVQDSVEHKTARFNQHVATKLKQSLQTFQNKCNKVGKKRKYMCHVGLIGLKF